MFRKKEDRPQPLPVRACEVAIKRGDMCFELFNLHIALGNRAVSRADDRDLHVLGTKFTQLFLFHYQVLYKRLSTNSTKVLYQRGSFLVQKLVLLFFSQISRHGPFTEK